MNALQALVSVLRETEIPRTERQLTEEEAGTAGLAVEIDHNARKFNRVIEVARQLAEEWRGVKGKPVTIIDLQDAIAELPEAPEGEVAQIGLPWEVTTNYEEWAGDLADALAGLGFEVVVISRPMTQAPQP